MDKEDPFVTTRDKHKTWMNVESFADTFLSPIAKFGAYFFFISFCLALIVSALFGGLWWLNKQASWLEGFIPVIFLWAFAFNELPTQGRKCLENKFNMQFVLPVAVLSTIGFVFGLLR